MKITRSENIEKVRLILGSDPSQEFSGERTSQDSKKQLVNKPRHCRSFCVSKEPLDQ